MLKKIIIILVLLLTAYSCSFTTAESSKPPIAFDPEYLNQQIKLIAVSQFNSFNTEDPVSVLLEYDTKNKIVFPSNYNLRIFNQIDNQWIVVSEKHVITPQDQVILSPDIPSSYGQIVTFFPALGDITITYHMRVYVFGDMTTSNGTVKVGAYVDFVLSP